jgi:hypothetical protein
VLPGIDPPDVSELAQHPVVLVALEEAWADSYPDDPVLRHEEGGWIYADLTSGALTYRRAPAGSQAALDLDDPPLVAGSVVVVATYHPIPTRLRMGGTHDPAATIRAPHGSSAFRVSFGQMTAYTRPDRSQGGVALPATPGSRSESERSSDHGSHTGTTSTCRCCAGNRAC